MQNIAILGSTGSIGIQALNVLEHLGDRFKVRYLTANKNYKLLLKQAQQYNPEAIVIADKSSYSKLKNLSNLKCKVLQGEDAIEEIASDKQNNLVLNALVGFSGLKPTISAIKAGIKIALANKETLVVAGSIIKKLLKKNKSKLIPIDSEHNAILQILIGEETKNIEKIILTASGGPFYKLPKSKFKQITVNEALAHPNWSMGNKITIDSATMMNKGFEIIEAHWLFDIDYHKIEVLIHPQSIVHSLVEFVDGSVKAQLGVPDMRIPISFALTYPERLKYNFPKLDLLKISKLEFFKPDLSKFKCLQYAYYCIEKGGSLPTVLNASNEVAVDSFIRKKITFDAISEVIYESLNKMEFISNPSIEEIFYLDKATRRFAKNFINKKN